MTNTTDIAAQEKWLRAACEAAADCGYVHNISVDGRTIEWLLDQLEAERQRADAICHDIRIQANDLKSAQTVNKVLQAEIAALKAKLANPVVLSDCDIGAVSHMAHWYSEGECVAWVSGAEHVKKQILAAGFKVKEE